MTSFVKLGLSSWAIDKQPWWLGMRFLLVLVLLACCRADPGISRENAEAVMRSFDFTDLSLQPIPNGWTGTAVPQGGGYRMSVTVDQQGVMQVAPDVGRC
jgi:hypothetical protein